MDQPDQCRLQPDFQPYSPRSVTGTCEAAKIGHSGCQSGQQLPRRARPACHSRTTDCVSCGLTATRCSAAYWGLGDRGFAPFQGGTNVFHIADSLRYDSRQAQHPRRRTGSRPADECADQRFPGRLLRLHQSVGPISSPSGRRHAADFLLGLTGRARFMIRPSRVPPPVAAGNCSAPTSRMTGG